MSDKLWPELFHKRDQAMTLTAAQKTTLKTDIAANTNTVVIGGTTFQIKDIGVGDRSTEAAQKVAAWYNLLCAVDFFGNYSSVPADAIFNAVSWKNYTPTDPGPTDTAQNAAIHAARTALAGAFQMNLQTMLIGRATIDATKASTVQGLKDCTNADMPMGTAGAAVKGGWSGASGVIAALCRKGTNAEKLFANTSGGSGADSTHAATFTVEGSLSSQDILDAWAS